MIILMHYCNYCGMANSAPFCVKCNKYIDELFDDDEDLTVTIDDNLFVKPSGEF